MSVFLGSVLLLAFVASVVGKLFVRKQAVQPENSRERVQPASHPLLLQLTSIKTNIATFVLGFLLVFSSYIFFYAETGNQYLVVYPNGSKSAVMEEGFHFCPFAKIYPWQKFIDIKVTQEGEDISEIEGAMSPIPTRFVDQVTANVIVSTRFQLPDNDVSFIALAVEYRSLKNLIQTTLIPTVAEVVSNTGYMFAAQDYISGSASDFRVAVDEQLKFGKYSVEKRTFYDTIVLNQEFDQSRNAEVRTRYEVIKRLDESGVPIRLSHDINKNNIIVSQVIVNDVQLDPTFKKRLEAQRDESAKRQLEQQKIKTAKDAKARIIAEGERDKASERMMQEKNQVAALISMETKLKQESTKKDLAVIQLETEKLLAAKVKVTADAAAYEITKKVHAGITPEVKLKMMLARDVAVATEIAKIKFPETMIIGGGGKGGTPLETLIGAAMAKQLTDKTTAK